MTIIAIDGPSGSGKSTIAKGLAERLRLPYLDTGAMYRAVALMASRKGIDFHDDVKLTKVAAETIMQMLDERPEGKLMPRIVIAGADETLNIRSPEISQGASAVAVHAGVRERLVSRQRNWIMNRKGGVIEGRDIGTVVFPEADLKIFLTASAEERVKRRQDDENAPEFSNLSSEQTHQELAERDARDSGRSHSPLEAAADAIVVDTSGQDIDEVIINILSELRKRCGGELPMGTAS